MAFIYKKGKIAVFLLKAKRLIFMNNSQVIASTENFSQHNKAANSVLLVGVLFTAFLILSNLSAAKIAAVGQFYFPAGLIFFPLTYIFDDILTEVYGFKTSRRIIWVALLANLIVFSGTWLITYLPYAPDWHDQAAFATVYRTAPRIFFASTLAYFFGEFTNSYILAKLKIKLSGRFLSLRFISSSLVGVAVDNIIFVHAAFLFTVPYTVLWQMVFTVYIAKVSYEILATPLTCKIAHYLKHKDNMDVYDYQTNFNPFSLVL